MTERIGWVGEFAVRFASCKSDMDMQAVLDDLVIQLGAKHYILGMHPGKHAPPQNIFVSNYPLRFRQFFDDHRGFDYCPVIGKCLVETEPFSWEGLHTTPEQLA